MMCCYALIPDGVRDPVAVFAQLEDAIDWGLRRYGGDSFRIRYEQVTAVARGEDHGSPGPV